MIVKNGIDFYKHKNQTYLKRKFLQGSTQEILKEYF